MGQRAGGRMNIAGLIMLAVIGYAAWVCLRSDWHDFEEYEESADDEDEHSKPDSWGV
jgi:hypothetical protein